MNTFKITFSITFIWKLIEKAMSLLSILSPLLPLPGPLSSSNPPMVFFWNHSTRAITIDRKTLPIAFNDHYRGSRAIVKETYQSSSQNLSITWRSLTWSATSFKSFYKEPSSYKFFAEHRSGNCVLWIEKLRNKHGYFVEINHLKNNEDPNTLG